MFADRTDAGRRLGKTLSRFKDDKPIVYGLPRGGVPVAAEVAKVLGAPLDIVLVRKIGAPCQPELALGALSDGPAPIVFWNQDLVRAHHVAPDELSALAEPERKVIEERSSLYRAHRPALSPEGRLVILVDDGLATGATARVALRALRRRCPRSVILAVPVAPAETVASMRAEADEVVVLETPRHFASVGEFYLNFEQTSDSEVVSCLDRLATGSPPRGTGNALA